MGSTILIRKLMLQSYNNQTTREERGKSDDRPTLLLTYVSMSNRLYILIYLYDRRERQLRNRKDREDLGGDRRDRRDRRDTVF